MQHKIVYSVGSIDTSEYEVNTHEFCDKNRTELDSHDNIPVIGSNARVIATSYITCDVRDFSPDICPLKVKIVDVAVDYSCPYTGVEYILVIRNWLHVPEMVNKSDPNVHNEVISNLCQ